MHQCFQRRCPQYIFDLVSFRTGTGRLHSATTRAAVIHRPLTPLVACHIVKLCNSLPLIGLILVHLVIFVVHCIK